MRRLLAATLLCVLSASAEEFSVGSKIAQFEVKDGSKTVTISPSNADATVLIFISTQCPISNSYNERMNALYKDYSGKNVHLVFVNANANESPAEITEHAKANRFAFAVYKDPGNVLADRFGATVTPETYIFDKSGVLRYHGYIDDAANPARAQVHGARKAIDAVLAGKPVEMKEARSFGCTIKRVRRSAL
ncbi:MAG: redoxin domain-containing protein [Bryobacteraceae bacterium]